MVRDKVRVSISILKLYNEVMWCKTLGDPNLSGWNYVLGCIPLTLTKQTLFLK